MSERLRAVVVGAGWAGEGHTVALRHCGVEVVALCARQPEVVRAVADRLEVPGASTDWRGTLERVRPEIVSLATPASLRGEVVEAATDLGCHVLCDKPLAVTAGEARVLYHLVERAGVKHAYASTHRYDPSVLWLAELVREEAIGTLREVEYTLQLGLPPLTPWSWVDSLALGGGMLNNGCPHVLGMLHTILGGNLRRVMGMVELGRQRAPVAADIHDFRQLFAPQTVPTREEAERLEWRAADADGTVRALLCYSTPTGEIPVLMVMRGGTAAPWPPNGWRFYGAEGMLWAEGDFSFTVSRLRGTEGEREVLPIPQRLLGELPQVGDDVQNKWVALVRDFVADVRGEPHRPYLTFEDGWRFQEAIEAIRGGRGWYELPQLPTEQPGAVPVAAQAGG